MVLGVILDVVLGQAEPVLDLLIPVFVVYFALECKRFRITRIETQHFVNLLQSQLVFVFRETMLSTFQGLFRSLGSNGLIDLLSKRSNRGMDVAFRFNLIED